MNSGQVCTAIKRMYVHESVYDAVVDAVTEVARTRKVGSGLEGGVELGPLNNRPQLERVDELVEDAKRAGATVRTGGQRREGPGYFYEPTVLTDVGDDARIVAEEQFGPALPILRFSDLDEVIDRANDSHFGLSGSVWTSDAERGAEIAAQLECGSGWVNQHIALTPFAPFGGCKWSGIGYESGKWGLDEFCELQAINVRK